MKRFVFFLLFSLVLVAPSEARRRWIPRTASGPFNPQTQGTLVNWYDGSTLGLSNGASVNPFTDSKTGAPNSLTTTATYPTYSTAQQNGLGVVTFDVPGTKYYTTNGSTASTFPYTIAAVVNVFDVTSARTILGPSIAGGLQVRVDQTNRTVSILKASLANIGTSTGTVTILAYHLIVITVDASSWAVYIDGVAAGSGSHAQSLVAATTFRMGASILAGTEGMNGGIGEVQIYNSILSPTDLAGLHTYIVNKWATP